jgi:hypothetical protein
MQVQVKTICDLTFTLFLFLFYVFNIQIQDKNVLTFSAEKILAFKDNKSNCEESGKIL